VWPRITPDRAHERVALLFGVVPGQGGQFGAKALGVHVQPVKVAFGDLDDEVVRYQSAALRHDGGPVIHLALYGARHLDRLQFGLEGTRECSLDHALQPSFEALQNSHSCGLPSAPTYPMVSGVRVHLRSC
jgi:hypothetical protein